jgi:hypothetical protein
MAGLGRGVGGVEALGAVRPPCHPLLNGGRDCGVLFAAAMAGSRASPSPVSADNSGDGNVENNPAPAVQCEAGSRCRLKAESCETSRQ